jgi:hypothetical protein
MAGIIKLPLSKNDEHLYRLDEVAIFLMILFLESETLSWHCRVATAAYHQTDSILAEHTIAIVITEMVNHYRLK